MLADEGSVGVAISRVFFLCLGNRGPSADSAAAESESTEPQTTRESSAGRLAREAKCPRILPRQKRNLLLAWADGREICIGRILVRSFGILPRQNRWQLRDRHADGPLVGQRLNPSVPYVHPPQSSRLWIPTEWSQSEANRSVHNHRSQLCRVPRLARVAEPTETTELVPKRRSP